MAWPSRRSMGRGSGSGTCGAGLLTAAAQGSGAGRLAWRWQGPPGRACCWLLRIRGLLRAPGDRGPPPAAPEAGASLGACCRRSAGGWMQGCGASLWHLRPRQVGGGGGRTDRHRDAAWARGAAAGIPSCQLRSGQSPESRDRSGAGLFSAGRHRWLRAAAQASATAIRWGGTSPCRRESRSGCRSPQAGSRFRGIAAPALPFRCGGSGRVCTTLQDKAGGQAGSS